MQVICECTRSNQPKIVVGAFENLVKIMSLYYDHMTLYMQHALFQVNQFIERS